MKLACMVGSHSWRACKCIDCGKARNKEHQSHGWTGDCERCSRCGATRANAHAWDGCTCKMCRKTRDQDHDWRANCERCSRCGATRSNAHQWDECTCKMCGEKKTIRIEGDSSLVVDAVRKRLRGLNVTTGMMRDKKHYSCGDDFHEHWWEELFLLTLPGISTGTSILCGLPSFVTEGASIGRLDVSGRNAGYVCQIFVNHLPTFVAIRDWAAKTII